jgi:parallel beta-helix repeat protein
MIVGDENEIQTNDVGFWPGNPTPLPNATGISIFGAKNRIGGGSASERNVVSGNTAKGIDIANGCCAIYTSNTIQGNYIGTDELGNTSLGNGQTGVQVLSHATNTAIVNNVISGNNFWGIELASATFTSIQGNLIGTNAAGTAPLGNRLGGIVMDTGARNNIVGGGTTAPLPNTIAFNGGPGVWVNNAPTINNRITGNSIYSNRGLGIDLGTTGVTPNDLMDPDRGPNMLQNFPVLLSANSVTKVIVGRLNSRPGQKFKIEFFASPVGSCDPSGHGEGMKFLGFKNVATNAVGNAAYSFTSPLAFPSAGVITATATDAAGNTSEFSACRAAK